MMKQQTMIDKDKASEPFLVEFSEVISFQSSLEETKYTKVNDETTDDD